MMGFSYVILPDGSILKVSSPADFITAATIAKDEAGDVLETQFGLPNAGCLLSTSCHD